MSLPAGFRLESNLLVNEGPTDAAAGRFTDTHAPALWSRQVLTDGRLRALAVVPPVAGSGPEQFQSVHATAERVAGELGIGAVEVAVWWADALTPHGAHLTAGDLAVVLLTSALDTALADAPGDNVIVLSSGAA
ncbi:MAG TPA: hypothetical protein VJX10_18665 [Pseudonocardiaceae bacterium]|nr:hypothetical protein [Pseudonocardiaceae bacterium]